MDLVEWRCSRGHLVDQYQDDGRDRAKRGAKRHPPFDACPGPWDDDLEGFRFECGLSLTYRLVPD